MVMTPAPDAALDDRRKPAGGPQTTASQGESSCVVVHATVVRWRGYGILLRGPSGAGKSDLALRLMEQGAQLIADDLVSIETCDDDRLVAKPPGEPGLIELRGQGIFRQPTLARTELDLCLDLVTGTASAADRLPEPATTVYCGCHLPLYRLDPFAASATARLAVLLTGERVA